MNVLLRNEKNVWNSSNAELLINFSEMHEFSMDFQLGNEPNSFLHVFNKSVSAKQLAEDFKSLRKILNNSELYRNSKLIGPDVTRPKNVEELSLQESSLKYLRDFLSGDIYVDVASWHQYVRLFPLKFFENFIINSRLVLDII